MATNNDNWLRKQCTAFLDSKLSDVILFDKAGLIRDAAKNRGISSRQVSDMYYKINNERSENEN